MSRVSSGLIWHQCITREQLYSSAFVPTVANQPNPEDHPIETYWKLIKDELKKEPRAAGFKTLNIGGSVSRIAEETIKSMMSTVRQKIKYHKWKEWLNLNAFPKQQ